MVIAGHNQDVNGALRQQADGVFDVFPGVHGAFVHQHVPGLHAVGDQPGTHHGGLCGRFIHAAGACHHHRHRLIPVGAQRALQPQFQLYAGAAIGVHLGAQHHDGMVGARPGQGVFPENQIAKQPDIGQRPQGRKPEHKPKQSAQTSQSSVSRHISSLSSYLFH